MSHLNFSSRFQSDCDTKAFSLLFVSRPTFWFHRQQNVFCCTLVLNLAPSAWSKIVPHIKSFPKTDDSIGLQFVHESDPEKLLIFTLNRFWVERTSTQLGQKNNVLTLKEPNECSVNWQLFFFVLFFSLTLKISKKKPLWNSPRSTQCYFIHQSLHY